MDLLMQASHISWELSDYSKLKFLNNISWAVFSSLFFSTQQVGNKNWTHWYDHSNWVSLL